MSELNAGDVKLELFGHGEVTLKPTLDACTRLSSMPGGLTKLNQRILDLEFSAIKLVIEAGLGKSSKDMDEIIYKSGLFSLCQPCIEFVNVVANGGRKLGEVEEDTDPLEKPSL